MEMMMIEKIAVIICGVAVFAGIVFCLVVVIPFIYDFRLTGSGVDVVLFKTFPIYRIPFSDMRGVRVVNAFSVMRVPVNPFRAIRIGNRFVLKGVLIEKRGTLTSVLITPKDAERLCEEIQARLGLVQTGGPAQGNN